SDPPSGPARLLWYLPGMSSSWTSLVLGLTARAVLSPSLARALLLVAWRFRRRNWYRRPPFLPLPARDYVRWRMHTAYGSHGAIPSVDDVVAYARWVAGGD
ncbi:MAG TPA: hypothetical protein VFG84_08310, partial [Gemmatimonadaceae bacterium]|nr:hypothetical protein [Gemmatimonadaceae bacterium]